MATLCILGIALLLLPSLQAQEQPSFVSFHLLLQPAPLDLHRNASALPLQSLTGPHVFSNMPLVRDSGTEEGLQVVGSAAGLYLASAADHMELRYIFFTVDLQNYQDAEDGAARKGTVVLVGNVSGGFLSIVAGAGDFAGATGQARVAMAPATSSTAMALSFELELIFRHPAKEPCGTGKAVS